MYFIANISDMEGKYSDGSRRNTWRNTECAVGVVIRTLRLERSSHSLHITMLRELGVQMRAA